MSAFESPIRWRCRAAFPPALTVREPLGAASSVQIRGAPFAALLTSPSLDFGVARIYPPTPFCCRSRASARDASLNGKSPSSEMSGRARDLRENTQKVQASLGAHRPHPLG